MPEGRLPPPMLSMRPPFIFLSKRLQKIFTFTLHTFYPTPVLGYAQETYNTSSGIEMGGIEMAAKMALK